LPAIDSARRTLPLAAALAVGLLAMEGLRLPIAARFEVWQFADYGANLTVQALLDRGERPTMDFFYPYGLLPLGIGRLWFAVGGRTPGAYLAAVAGLHMLAAWAIARVAVSLRTGWAGIALAFTALPLTFPPTYPNLAHGLEAVLIAHGLADLAAGRRDRALALAGLAALTKPSMAYAFGVLSLFELTIAARGRASIWLKSLCPLSLTCVPVMLVLVGMFGLGPFLRSQWPGTTADLYRHARYGFFRGSGRDFWLPRDAMWRHYVGTPRGFWLGATGVLSLGALGASARLLRKGVGEEDEGVPGEPGEREPGGPAPSLTRPLRGGPLPGGEGGESIARRRAAEVVVVCALLHVAFVVAFFGGENSWLYYSYILTIGVMALAGLGRRWRGVVAGVAALGLLADRGLPREIAREWRGVDVRVGGLWTSGDSAREWRSVLGRIGGRRAALLAMSGCGEVTYADRFLPPVTLFLLNGMEETRDVRRKAEQLRRADLVVVPKVPEGTLDFRLNCPAFRAALAGRTAVFDGTYYRVYE
jgi:hypothetical protein